jgi:hypothetical protein
VSFKKTCATGVKEKAKWKRKKGMMRVGIRMVGKISTIHGHTNPQTDEKRIKNFLLCE